MIKYHCQSFKILFAHIIGDKLALDHEHLGAHKVLLTKQKVTQDLWHHKVLADHNGLNHTAAILNLCTYNATSFISQPLKLALIMTWG